MRLADLVFDYLKKINVNTVYMLSGGGIMYLVDALGRSGIASVCCHHEQAASIAAQAHGMYNDDLGVCLVTTGPGGTNALTGCAAAFVDSTPVLYISGQVKTSDFASLRGVRQFGAQENDIISMAKPVTKYAVLIEKAEDILYELEKCVYISQEGRKGPVWIDIPLDIQSEEVDESSLRHFFNDKKRSADLSDDVVYMLNALSEAKRPVLLTGHGMFSSDACGEVENFIRKVKLPVLSTWRTLGFMSDDDPLFFGSPGLQAPRFSNLILQHSDLLIVLGSRLDNMITAFSEEHFAYRARKIIVDIDRKETDKLKMPGLHPVCSDIKDFMSAVNNKIACAADYSHWIERCKKIKERFPLLEEHQDIEEGINLYQAVNAVSEFSKPDDVIVASSTSRCNTAGHIAFNHKKGQRTISSMGMGSMGFALPSAVGAYFASGKKRIILFEGDGSLQLNIQELQTIVFNKVDAKIFIFSNAGYAAIATMQDRNFDGFHVGSDEKSGVNFPSLTKIANAYGIPYFRLDEPDRIKETVKKTLESKGAVLCEIAGSMSFDEIPKCISKIDENTGKRVSVRIENPYPFLSEKDMNEITDFLLSC